jgi:hypothetical protein
VLAKQYTIKLPADYDMEIIRRRVRERGGAFDAFPGLVFKAFLITERAAGATANRYAPFYVWRDTTGTNEFLFGAGFAALQGSFGRPLIEHWVPVELSLPAGERDRPPRSATREDIAVSDGEALADVRQGEREWLEQAKVSADGLYAATSALDPYRWQLVRFALWRGAISDVGGDSSTTRYEVLHLSRPSGRLARGDHAPGVASPP